MAKGIFCLPLSPFCKSRATVNAVEANVAPSRERTREHLARAWVALPADSESEALDYFLESLDHNELDLALEELEEVGRQRTAGGEFWVALGDAAQELGRTGDAQRYRTGR